MGWIAELSKVMMSDGGSMRLMIYSLMGVTLWGGFAHADRDRKDRNDNKPAPRDSKPAQRDNNRPDNKPAQRDNNRNDNRPAQRDNRPDNKPARRDYNRNDNRPAQRDNRNDNNRPGNYNRNDNNRPGNYNRNDNRPNNNYRGDNRRVNRVEKQYRRQPYRGTVRADRRAVTRTKLYHSNGTFRFHNGQTVVYRRPVITQRYYNFSVRPTIIVENYPSQYGYVWVSGSWSWNGAEWAWGGGHYAPDPAINAYYDDGSYDVGDDYVDGDD